MKPFQKFMVFSLLTLVLGLLAFNFFFIKDRGSFDIALGHMVPKNNRHRSTGRRPGEVIQSDRA